MHSWVSACNLGRTLVVSLKDHLEEKRSHKKRNLGAFRRHANHVQQCAKTLDLLHFMLALLRLLFCVALGFRVKVLEFRV